MISIKTTNWIKIIILVFTNKKMMDYSKKLKLMLMIIKKNFIKKFK